MTESKLAFRNLKRDFNIYILLIVSSSIFIALIIGFESTLISGDLGTMLSQEKLSDNKIFFKIVLWAIACGQYLLLFFFFSSYYRFINKIRVRELALYKVIGYSRLNVFKIIFMESMYIYFIVGILSIVFAFVINILITKFINYYLGLSTKLSASLDVTIIIITLILFLILVLANVLRTYYKAVKVDVDLALNEEANQKKIVKSPKYYIICMFILGVILLLNMTFLTTKATYSIMGGIIIMALFYAFGLFLIISSISKGYKYLVSKRYLKKNYNLLLISEVNFHINKSRLVILSSVIFMMLSIGALVLSQVIVEVIDKSFIEADYIVYLSDIDSDLENGEWDLEESNEDYIYSNTQIEIMEKNQKVLDNYEIDTSSNVLLMSAEAAKKVNLTNGEFVNLNNGNGLIKFKVYIEPKSNLIRDFDDEVEAFMPLNNILKVKGFDNFKRGYKVYEYLEDQVVKGNLKRVSLNGVWYTYDQEEEEGEIILESSIKVTKLSEYNEYLNMIGKKSIDLSDNEIWLDSLNSEDYPGYKIKGSSSNNLYTAVVNDKTFNELEKNVYYEDQQFVYYEAINNKVKMQIDEKLKDENKYPVTVIGALEKRALGNKVFILLIAFYIAIIFIISNAVLIAINLLSHAIENKKVYDKLSEMGMSNQERSRYISSFIRRFYLIPFIIGIISGIIVTNFAIKLLFNDLLKNTAIVNYKLIVYIMFIYIITYILFITITKYIYNKIIKE